MRPQERMMRCLATVMTAVAVVSAAVIVQAQHPPALEGELFSLKKVAVPAVPGIENFIRDNKAAIVLGKALFWEQQIGSDGMACASCHFHAGADSRLKNQLSPGLSQVPPDLTFQKTASGGAGGPTIR